MKAAGLLAAILFPLLAGGQIPADGPRPAADLRKLLQEGLFEEEANRNLDAASTAYEAVIQAFDKDRQFAATALFRLAEVRTKQNRKDEAMALYQRVMAEFGTVEPLAKLSRERLAALGGKEPASAFASEVSAEEADEISRLTDLVKNSPDLLNAVTRSSPADEGSTPLARAAQKGWLKAAEYLLDHGADINAPRTGRAPLYAPLYRAAMEGRKAMVELLIQRGADVNLRVSGSTPLQAAVDYSRLEVARVLLEHGAEPNVLAPRVFGPPAGVRGESPLHAACHKGDIAMARLLLEKGADANLVFVDESSRTKDGGVQAESPLMVVAGASDKVELMQLLLEHHADPGKEVGEGNLKSGPIEIAVSAGNLKSVELLIDSGAEPKSPGLVAKAAGRGDIEMIRLLAKRGARLDSRDATGTSALHYAVTISKEASELMLELGASPNVRRSQDDATPLWHTIATAELTPGQISKSLSTPPPPNAFEILNLLASKHADVNIPDKFGSTPLHIALFKQEVPLEIAEWLLKQGADPRLKDSRGLTPAEAAPLVRRLWLEQRTLFLPWTKLRAINVVIRVPGYASAEPQRFDAVADFDTPPPLPGLLVDATREMRRKGQNIPSSFEPILYRAMPDGVVEIGRGYGKLPPLQWGDVIVLYNSNNPGFSSSELEPILFGNIQPELRKLTIRLGEREAAVQMRDSGRMSWAPMIDPLPKWNFSELIAHITDSEPRARLGEIKVQRIVDGQAKEWQVDLRPDQPGTSVKTLPARLADGDTVVIPLNPLGDPEVLKARRAGIFWAAPGRVFGQRLFALSEKDDAPRTLGEFIAEAYGNSAMVVPNPDLQRIQIHRLNADGSAEQTTLVDLAKSIALVTDSTTPEEARKGDFPLEWGDVVELLPRKDSAPANWAGLGPQTELFLKAALTRTVIVASPGYEPKPLPLAPFFRQFRLSSGLWEPRLIPGAVVFGAKRAVSVKAEKNIAKIRLFSRGTMREFTPEELDQIDPWLLDGDKLEIERL